MTRGAALNKQRCLRMQERPLRVDLLTYLRLASPPGSMSADWEGMTTMAKRQHQLFLGIGITAVWLGAAGAGATGPNDPVVLQSSDSDRPGEFDIVVAEDGVQSIEVRATIREQRNTIGAPVEEKIDGAPGAEGEPVLAKGRSVRANRTYSVSLPPGLYAEYVILNVGVRGHGGPWPIGRFRHFRVLQDGSVQKVTQEEYDAESEIFTVGPKGERERQGARGPSLEELPRNPAPSEAYRLPDDPRHVRQGSDQSERGE
jgi:hypothetical protein